jgi:hypothetical protein
MINKIIGLILNPINKYLESRRLKRRLEELRKRDPFIYK